MTTETNAVETPTRVSKTNRSGRKKRAPIHGYRSILGVQGLEEGWHYVWINDDQVDRFLEGGYDFVEHSVIIGDRSIDAASQVGGRISKAVGNGVTGFLMRCPEEIYQEELAMLEQDVSEKESAMKNRLNSGEDGRYGKVVINQSKPIGSR